MNAELEKCLGRGWALLPLVKGTKIPALPSHDADPNNSPIYWRNNPASREQVEKWENEGHNFGVWAGRVSGIVIIDIDTAEGLALYLSFGLPKTLTAKTRKGYHFYFLIPPGVDPELYGDWQRMFKAGIDRRSDKFYAVMPPSVVGEHTYTWHGGSDRQIIPLPEIFWKKKPVGDVSTKVDAAQLPLVGAGLRNTYLAQVGGSLRRQGLGQEAMFHALKAVYEERCEHTPPLDDSEIMAVAKSMTRYDPAPFAVADAGPGSNAAPITLETLRAYNELLARRAVFKEPELTTGFRAIDELIDGYSRGDITAVGAWTGGGKTTFLTNSINALCLKGKKVVYFSTEMSRFQIYDKLVAMNASINYKLLRRGLLTADERTRFDAFTSKFSDYKLVVDDSLRPAGDVMRAVVQRERPDVFVLDHIHQVSADYSGLSDLSKKIKSIASEFNAAAVIATQFSRPQRVMDKKTGELTLAKRPTLYEIKACGDIENIMATVLLLYDLGESLEPEVNLLNAEIAKCRHGEKGMVYLDWYWKRSLLVERGGKANEITAVA